MFPTIEPAEVGNSGLLWLFVSYGYMLYYASNLISDGSELLLLVPSMANIVGSVVLPLLGAVPDGAIMLFSGLGPIEDAQESLSVGVGALVGSTVMLLTIPWSLSVLAGAVNLNSKGEADYFGKPKLTDGIGIFNSGVIVKNEIKSGGIIILITTIPFFLIQGPASLYLGGSSTEVAAGEKPWALVCFIICVVGFILYLAYQVRSASRQQEMHYIELLKKSLGDGSISLKGALCEIVHRGNHVNRSINAESYDSIDHVPCPEEPPDDVKRILEHVMILPFRKFDVDNSGGLDKNEVRGLFSALNEKVRTSKLQKLFEVYDRDASGILSFDEVVTAAYTIILHDETIRSIFVKRDIKRIHQSIRMNEEEEEEDIPDEFIDLSPEEQQRQIKKSAFLSMAVGTLMVIIFSDPMVDVMQEIGVRMNISPFYVSFVLAPLASNASELITSYSMALKKTSTSITLSLATLQGAAAMNNTFCLSIFMALIYFRGIAWQYTAETIAIVLVQWIIVLFCFKTVMTRFDAFLILAIFPLSLIIVAGLESVGMD